MDQVNEEAHLHLCVHNKRVLVFIVFWLLLFFSYFVITSVASGTDSIFISECISYVSISKYKISSYDVTRFNY